jgi:hypothetical protein
MLSVGAFVTHDIDQILVLADLESDGITGKFWWNLLYWHIQLKHCLKQDL